MSGVKGSGLPFGVSGFERCESLIPGCFDDPYYYDVRDPRKAHGCVCGRQCDGCWELDRLGRGGGRWESFFRVSEFHLLGSCLELCRSF